MDWVGKHVTAYLESSGATGQRYSGKDGERYVVVASNGGKPTHPTWYVNLLADPSVQVQDGAERFAARSFSARSTTWASKPARRTISSTSTTTRSRCYRRTQWLTLPVLPPTPM